MRVDTEAVLARVDGEYAVRVTRDLVRIPSENPPGDVSRVAEFILDELRSMGLRPCETLAGDPRKPNFLIQLGEGGPGHLAISGHMDTVPVSEAERPQWGADPFGGELREGRIYGRGSADMKGALAATLACIKALRESRARLPGRLTWALVSDGESGDWMGVQHLADRGVLRRLGADMVLYTESTDLSIIRQFKGRIFFEVEVRGKPVHVSVPERGVNAIEKMASVVAALSAHRLAHAPHPFLGPSTLAFSTIAGGSAVNMVAGHCRATFDVRMVPGQAAGGVKGELEGVLRGLAARDPALDAELRFLPGGVREVIEIPEGAPVVRLLQEVIPRVTGEPARFMEGVESPGGLYLFVKEGVPGVFFGPGGAIWEAHMPNESVRADRVVGAAKVLALAALRVAGGGRA